jgi:hypothetical protein
LTDIIHPQELHNAVCKALLWKTHGGKNNRMWQQHSFLQDKKFQLRKNLATSQWPFKQWTLKFFFTGRNANPLYQLTKSGSYGELAMNPCIDFLWRR